jgi:large subunit ribosomal protein L15
MKLHDLNPNPGSKKNRKRVGRGISAGQGKTAGRGTTGEGSRPGQGGHHYRQGGNLPFYRRLPFIRGEGFSPLNTVEYNEINLDQLTAAFKEKAEVTPKPCRGVYCVIRATRWSFSDAVRSMSAQSARASVSTGAKRKIEAAGGRSSLWNNPTFKVRYS